MDDSKAWQVLWSFIRFLGILALGYIVYAGLDSDVFKEIMETPIGDIPTGIFVIIWVVVSAFNRFVGAKK